MRPMDSHAPTIPAREVALAFGAYLLATIWWLWPLPSVLATHLPDLKPGNQLVLADLRLILWALSWVTHALVTAPLHLFDANSFHPMPASLAYSEHFLGYVPLFAPAYGATGNPALAGNVTLLLVFPLRGAAMYLLARLFAPAPAALVAGLFYAFVPEGRAQLMKFHLHGVFYLPVALFLTERWLDRGRTRDAVLLAGMLALQAATSFYLAFAQVFGYGAYLAAALLFRLQRLDRRRLVGLALVGIVVGTWIVLLGLPYLALQASGVVPAYGEGGTVPLGLRPGVASQQVRAHLAKGGIGLLGYGLVVLALLPPWRGRGRGIALGLTVALAGIIAASGPMPVVLGRFVWSPYALFHDLLPGLSTVRMPARFVVVADLGLCLLAAIGAGRLTQWAGRRPAWIGCATLSLVFLVSVAPREPLPVVPHGVGAATPAPYTWLAANGEGRPLIELPKPRWPEAARRMLGSSTHWLPIVDGYSGYPVQSDDYLHSVAAGLPDESRLQNLVDLVDLGWILVHTDRLSQEQADRWRSASIEGLPLAQRFGDSYLFRVEREPDVDLRSLLLSKTHTLEGRPRSRVGDACPGSLRIVTSREPPWHAGALLPIRVWVQNDGTETWPAAGILPTGLVRLRLCLDRGTADCASVLTRIDQDVPPGSGTFVRPEMFAPRRSGKYVLTAELVQVGERPLSDCGVEPVQLPVRIKKRRAASGGRSPREALRTP